MNTQQLKNLICETTIFSIFDSKTDRLLFGSSDDISRFQKNRGNQVNLESVEKQWQKKFNSFGTKWNKSRQLYRLFYDQFRLYYRSFEQLRFSKISYLNSKNKNGDYFIHEFATVNLCAMYLFGKKMVDLIKELKLEKTLNKDNKNMLSRFSRSRDVLFEHNFNSWYYPDFIFETDLWSIASSDSFLRINIHTKAESEYYALLDYYQDYYDLEEIAVKIIKSF